LTNRQCTFYWWITEIKTQKVKSLAQ